MMASEQVDVICPRCGAETVGGRVGALDDQGQMKWSKVIVSNGWRRMRGRVICPDCFAEWNDGLPSVFSQFVEGKRVSVHDQEIRVAEWRQ